MKREGDGGPSVSGAGKRRQTARQERLAMALRDNLLKRKRQSRERSTAEFPEERPAATVPDET